MRSNQPQARGRSALSLTRNFKASNADSHTKSAIRGGPRREARTQRFGNKWKRTRSRSDRWHITTERTGNILVTGAWFRAGAAARARSGGGRSGVRAHSVLAASRSRLEWVDRAAPDAAATRVAGRAGSGPAPRHPLGSLQAVARASRTAVLRYGIFHFHPLRNAYEDSTPWQDYFLRPTLYFIPANQPPHHFNDSVGITKKIL